MSKSFKLQTKSGRTIFMIIRQMPHDPQYKVGSRIPGCGVVIEILPADTLESHMDQLMDQLAAK